MILVDTDVLIWNLRGNERAAEALDSQGRVRMSAVSYMELLQGLRDKPELRALRQAISWWDAEIVHLNEGISARAAFLLEQHSLPSSLMLADALIAATALERGVPLLTGNDKHYRVIEGLEVSVFRP